MLPTHKATEQPEAIYIGGWRPLVADTRGRLPRTEGMQRYAGLLSSQVFGGQGTGRICRYEQGPSSNRAAEQTRRFRVPDRRASPIQGIPSPSAKIPALQHFRDATPLCTLWNTADPAIFARSGPGPQRPRRAQRSAPRATFAQRKTACPTKWQVISRRRLKTGNRGRPVGAQRACGI